jgi:hypothetical protein
MGGDAKKKKKKVADLTKRCEDVLKSEAERRAADESKHSEDVEKLKNVNAQLKSNLEAMLSAPQRK